MAFIPAEETLITEVSLDDFVVRNKTATFMMRVQSDEYTHLAVLRGDLLVVERNVLPASRTLIVIGSEHGWRLAQTNTSTIPAIVVRGVVRRYE